MGRKASVITLSDEDRSYLETQTKARTIQAQTVMRARILLLKADGLSIDAIADKVDMNRKSIMLCINKYLEGGVENALFDAPGRGRNAEITDDEKAWIINIACQKPVDLGYSAEVWTRALLTKHINKFAENRDPDFDQKMHNVLLVYKQLSLQFDETGQLLPLDEDGQVVHVLSYDEKPGIQATANTSEDLLPAENHRTINRDYEYKRLGTVALLAGIDLQTGEAIPLVRDRHSSKEYVEFLSLLDAKYPKGDKIRLVLDNLKVHTSEETRKYLAKVPGRFEFVFTPKHGSWLNLVEGFFSKLTRQFLKGIRVKTKEELVERIYKYFDEVNADPVVYHWKYKLDEIDSDEKIQVETLVNADPVVYHWKYKLDEIDSDEKIQVETLPLKKSC